MPADLRATFESTGVHVAMVGIGLALLFVLARELRYVPGKLIVLMFTAFVDMAGLFMVVPLIPFYVSRLGAGGVSVFGFEVDEGTLLGLVVSSFTVAQLLSAPFWGRFSDRFGRRPVMLVALTASAAAYLLFGFAETLWLLLLSRVVQGAGGGNGRGTQPNAPDASGPSQATRPLGPPSAPPRYPTLPASPTPPSISRITVPSPPRETKTASPPPPPTTRAWSPEVTAAKRVAWPSKVSCIDLTAAFGMLAMNAGFRATSGGS